MVLQIFNNIAGFKLKTNYQQVTDIIKLINPFSKYHQVIQLNIV